MSFPVMPSYLFEQITRAEGRTDKVFEAVIGLVVDNVDPERLGRVLVTYPTLPGEDKSFWAPIISLGAGKDRGWHFLPEPKDEVLILFQQGDIRKPLVLGALWNGKDLPPDTNDGDNERRSFTSREGSRVTFDDTEGIITLEDGGGFAKITITIENEIIFEALQGDVCIQAPSKDMNIVAKNIEMTAQQNANIAVQGDFRVASDGTSEIKSGAMLTVQGKRLDLNPGSAAQAEEAQDECEEVPDPIGP